MPLIRPTTLHDGKKLSAMTPLSWNSSMEEFLFHYVGSEGFESFVAEIENEVVATGSIFYFGTSAWLGNIIVDEFFRRRGYGTAMTEYLVKRATDWGCTTISLIATEEGKQIYSPLGFYTESEYHFYRHIPSCEKTTDERIISLEEKYIPAVIDLDCRITGEKRLPALKPFLNEGYIFREDDDLRGCYLPKAGNGMIIAADDEGGLSLLALKHRVKNQTTVIPASNRGAAEWFESKKIAPDLTAVRMFRGESIDWKPEGIFCRIAGYCG